MIGLSIKLEIEVESENCFCSTFRRLNGSAGINCCPKILPFCKFLYEQGVEILSTGGTSNELRGAGLEITEVSDYTLFPEILGGRVITLHPLIHGGILGKSWDSKHLTEMEQQKILKIDLVVVNLYPFKETISSQADYDECIENVKALKGLYYRENSSRPSRQTQ